MEKLSINTSKLIDKYKYIEGNIIYVGSERIISI